VGSGAPAPVFLRTLLRSLIASLLAAVIHTLIFTKRAMDPTDFVDCLKKSACGFEILIACNNSDGMIVGQNVTLGPS
jgi:hypothetical protein